MDLFIPDKWGGKHHISHVEFDGPHRPITMSVIVGMLYWHCDKCDCYWRLPFTRSMWNIYKGDEAPMFSHEEGMEHIVNWCNGFKCDAGIVRKFHKHQYRHRKVRIGIMRKEAMAYKHQGPDVSSEP